MRIKKSTAVAVSALLAVAMLTISSCGGKKTAPPKPDDEPGLRENKAKMMERLD